MRRQAIIIELTPTLYAALEQMRRDWRLATAADTFRVVLEIMADALASIRPARDAQRPAIAGALTRRAAGRVWRRVSRSGIRRTAKGAN